jgi:hypothetical protein
MLAELSVRALGGQGPSLLTAAWVSLTLVWFGRALRQAAPTGGAFTAVVFLWTLGIQAFTWWQERPYHAGHALFVLALLLVQGLRQGRERALWLFVPLTCLWANLHGSWILGPALLASTAVGMRFDHSAASSFVRRALLIAALAFLAAGLSPAGPGIYLYPLRHSLLESTLGIEEWKPMDLSQPEDIAYLVMLLAYAFLLGNAKERRAAGWLPCLGLGFAAALAMRHAPYAAMLLAPELVGLRAVQRPVGVPTPVLGALKTIDSLSTRLSQRSGSGWVWVALLLAALSLRAALNPETVRDRLEPNRFPMAALDALAAEPAGKVLNRFTFGGLVSYFAGPQYKVFIDPRNDPYPAEIHRAYDALLSLGPGWEEALETYAPDYVLWTARHPGSLLLESLRQRGWEKVAGDASGELWRKSITR